MRTSDVEDDRVEFFGRTSRSALRRAARRTAALQGLSAPPRWRDTPAPLGATTPRATPAQMLAAVAAAKKRGRTATRGGPEGHDPLGEFTVWIGDAKFVVPRSFYYSGEYREVLPTEDDALEYIWPIQVHYRAMGKGLSTEEMHGLWGCIDLEPDEGWFFKEVDSRGIGGYAGRALYWVTQYLAMFWEFTRDGEVVDGEETPCSGIADAVDVLFREGTKSPSWHVIGGGFGDAEYFDAFPGRQSCLDTSSSSLGQEFSLACSGVQWDFYGVVPVLDGSDVYDLTMQITNPKGLETISRRWDSAGSATRQVLYYGVEFPPAYVSPDTSDGGAYFNPEKPCSYVFKARTLGQAGRTADAYLHWAHVAAALALTCDSFSAAPYLEAAILLGRYAALAIVQVAGVAAHEIAHRFTHSISHFDGKCCMCTIAIAWESGVAALLGLPDNTGAGSDDRLTTYPEFVLARDSYCSTDYFDSGRSKPIYSWYTWYASPGSGYGERGFVAFDVGRVDATMESVYVFP